jgi:anti-sigma factor RsiW
MSENDHVRAAQLIFRSQVENVTAELEWLGAHLALCQACAERAAATNRAILAIRSATVQVPPDLVERTRLRVLRRTEQLARRSVPGMWFWLISALSWAWIVTSTILLWRGLGSVAHRVGIPSPIWQMGFALWWAVPALVLGAVLGLRFLQDAQLTQE